jgi:ribosome-associated protein
VRVEEFLLGGEFIELGPLLKTTGICDTGGEAKHLVQEGRVRVHGDIERRRGRKLRGGEIVEAKGRKVRVVAPAGSGAGSGAGTPGAPPPAPA